ncbi:uncharacterized protein LOC128840784 isoform X2 [Malaclemys terrapin pileata]|uniref:uncharacterized protein LOC128840784 isoform X2 n=1 Tax=Malaclemys terrapin pileata TaxID=2991368 RepID=UPI0023A823E6|nr:uncharacterized protein LOC128840784 isoform X2 [Malaclemys terrapin pileata]
MTDVLDRFQQPISNFMQLNKVARNKSNLSGNQSVKQEGKYCNFLGHQTQISLLGIHWRNGLIKTGKKSYSFLLWLITLYPGLLNSLLWYNGFYSPRIFATKARTRLNCTRSLLRLREHQPDEIGQGINQVEVKDLLIHNHTHPHCLEKDKGPQDVLPEREGQAMER